LQFESKSDELKYHEEELEEKTNEAIEKGLEFTINDKRYHKAPFSQLITDNIIYLVHMKPDYLSSRELALIMKLASITQKNKNLLVKAERRTNYGYRRKINNPATIAWMADFFNYSSRSHLSKIMKSLIKKGIVLEERGVNKHTARRLYLNPEIVYVGRKNSLGKELSEVISEKRKEEGDTFEKNDISLPWKFYWRKNKRSAKLYSRQNYNKYIKEKKEQDNEEILKEEFDLEDFELEKINYDIINFMKNRLTNHHPSRFMELADGFLDSFLEIIDKIAQTEKEISGNYGLSEQDLKAIIKLTSSFTPIVEQFSAFLEVFYEGYKRYRHVTLLYSMETFFTEMYTHTAYSREKKTKEGSDKIYSHIHFLLHELFLIAINEFKKHSNYNTTAEFLHREFQLPENSGKNVLFTDFCFAPYLRPSGEEDWNAGLPLACFLQNIEKQELNYLKRVQKRMKEEILQTDLLLYYLTLLNSKPVGKSIWYPRFYELFGGGDFLSVHELKNLERKEYLYKIRKLYSVKNSEELKNNIRKARARHIPDLPTVEDHIAPYKVGSR